MSTQTHSSTQHGVFMNIFNTGVLLTGESGSGKSETALSLLHRGHQLIADDIVTLTQQDDQTLLGTCPASLQGLLEIRGLGIFNVTHLFGEKATIPAQTLSLIIHFEKTHHIERKTDDQPTQLKKIMSVEVPYIALPYSKERRFDILIETLTRHTIQGVRS